MAVMFQSSGFVARPTLTAESALETLANKVRADRAQAWKEVGLLLPILGSEITKHIKLIRALKPRQRPGNCTVCGLPRPHRDHAARSHHARIRFRKNAIQKYWATLNTPELRAAHTEKARAAALAKRHQTWLEALPPRLVKTQGRELALRYFRSLSTHQQKKLLAARKKRIAAERNSPLA